MAASEQTAAAHAEQRIEPWKMEAADVASALETVPDRGLDEAAAGARLTEYGRNELTEKKQRPTWMLFVDQFTSPMILVLVAAAAVTFVIGRSMDTVGILASVVFNGLVGVVQE